MECENYWESETKILKFYIVHTFIGINAKSPLLHQTESFPVHL